MNSEVKLPNVIRSSTINPGFSGNECSLELDSAIDGKRSSYTGLQNKSQRYALIFNPRTQSFTLERIDTEFTFGNGNTSQRLDEQSEDGIINTLIDQEGTADADDPYDWRHQLKRERTPTPDLEPFDPLGIDALGTPSPEPRPRKAKPKPFRKASTPPEQLSIELEASPSPEQEQEPDEALQQEEEESDDGGLQIVMDGATKPRHRFRGRFNQRLDAAPISLRSAASSQSPALNKADDSEESDVDVDEMKLGSPMGQRRRDIEVEPEQEEAAEPADAGQDINMEDEMEAAFAEALEAGDEDEQANAKDEGPTASYADESSSESEEE